MPALDVFAVALAALLVAFAWSLIFSRGLGAVRPYVPGLFLPLFDTLARADAAIYNALRAWADPAMQPFSDAVTAVVTAARSLIDNPLAFARAVSAALLRLFNVEIPYAIRVALDDAASLFAQAEGYAQSLFQGLQQQLSALAAELASLPAQLQNLYQLVTGYALGLAHQVESYALALASVVIRDAASLTAQETLRAVTAEQAVQAQAQAEAQALAAALDHEVVRFESELGNLAQGLAGEVAQARAALESDLGNLDTLLEGKIAAAVDAFPNAIIGRISPDARASLEADIEAIVTVGLARIRAEIRDVDALRARYGPIVAAQIAKLRGPGR